MKAPFGCTCSGSCRRGRTTSASSASTIESASSLFVSTEVPIGRGITACAWSPGRALLPLSRHDQGRGGFAHSRRLARREHALPLPDAAPPRPCPGARIAGRRPRFPPACPERRYWADPRAPLGTIAAQPASAQRGFTDRTHAQRVVGAGLLPGRGRGAEPMLEVRPHPPVPRQSYRSRPWR